jgi:hypothetical protein
MRVLYLLLALAAAPLSANEPVAQYALIDATIAKFPLQVDGKPEFYFLGFAGYGEERVFAEEIKLAAARVGEKYGSTDRTLLLINDRRDLTTYPLATGLGLRHAVNALGKAMNRDEDVLFLVLSSHGARNAMLEVSNTDMPARGLAADDLAEILRQSGIRWQVVVVSACFSGAFVKPLAHPESIVITASSKHRTSFGCSDERHLTYFGEAFFRDAFPAAPDLRAAAEATRRAIRSREREEKVTPSQPQSHFGAAIEPKLREWGPGPILSR